MEELSYSHGLIRTSDPSRPIHINAYTQSLTGILGSYIRHYFPALWRTYNKLTGANKGIGSTLADTYVLKTSP